jgi:hypothetical protein
LVQRARTLLNALAEEHKGTPWELLARTEAGASFGLEWVPLANRAPRR